MASVSNKKDEIVFYEVGRKNFKIIKKYKSSVKKCKFLLSEPNSATELKQHLFFIDKANVFILGITYQRNRNGFISQMSIAQEHMFCINQFQAFSECDHFGITT
jgi:hypothetical protein